MSLYTPEVSGPAIAHKLSIEEEKGAIDHLHAALDREKQRSQTLQQSVDSLEDALVRCQHLYERGQQQALQSPSSSSTGLLAHDTSGASSSDAKAAGVLISQRVHTTDQYLQRNLFQDDTVVDEAAAAAAASKSVLDVYMSNQLELNAAEMAHYEEVINRLIEQLEDMQSAMTQSKQEEEEKEKKREKERIEMHVKDKVQLSQLASLITMSTRSVTSQYTELAEEVFRRTRRLEAQVEFASTRFACFLYLSFSPPPLSSFTFSPSSSFSSSSFFGFHFLFSCAYSLFFHSLSHTFLFQLPYTINTSCILYSQSSRESRGYT